MRSGRSLRPCDSRFSARADKGWNWQELDIARLQTRLSLSENGELEQQRQAERLKDLQKSIDLLSARLEEANRKLAFQETDRAEERKRLNERVRVVGDKERVAQQQLEILEETLNLHRKRVSKQYKKIDRLTEQLADAKAQEESLCEEIRNLKVTLREEHDRSEKLHQELVREVMFRPCSTDLINSYTLFSHNL